MMFARRFLQFRVANHKLICRRNKYIVLLPEIPSDTPENNPLLRTNTLPQFSQLTVDKCVNAIGKLVIEYESGIHDLDQRFYDENIQKNIQNVILPLDRLSGHLDFAWGVFKILFCVKRNERIANAYVKLHSRIVKAKHEKYFSLHLYKAFKELKENEAQFTEAVRRIIDKHLLESKLFGIELLSNNYKIYQTAVEKLDEHRQKYMNNLSETTSKFSHNLEFKDIEEIPQELLHLFSEDKTNITKGPWKVTLDPYIYKIFLQYCSNRLLRWNAWYAYNTRATAISGTDLNNSIHVEEIRFQRQQIATILGYKSFAEMSMTTKMASSVENVIEMLTTLHVKSKSKTSNEIKELQEFANKSGFPDSLELWDIPYWQRLHKEELFNVDDDGVRQYFPFPKVMDGIFKLCQKLFNITFQEVKDGIDLWDKDVMFYNIIDENGKVVASFYLDPYLRSSEKIQSSIMEVGQNRSDVMGKQPLSYLVFSFSPPAFGKPSLLSFEDLKHLLQKFGHLLQHSLTTVPYSEVAGLTNLEWDVVNVCPLVMSSFLKHHGTIASLSSHVDTGKTIPLETHEQLLKRDNYMAGLGLSEQLFLSALDIELYNRKDYWLVIAKEMWLKYMPFTYPKDTAKPCSFPEILSDQYPAAYFSNLWAKMIAADIFNAFEEAGLDNSEDLKQVGKRFQDTFLALGGGCHPGEVFRKFRGRDPSIDALLVDLDLVNNKNNN